MLVIEKIQCKSIRQCWIHNLLSCGGSVLDAECSPSIDESWEVDKFTGETEVDKTSVGKLRYTSASLTNDSFITRVSHSLTYVYS